ncbi:MAG: bifunctional riboflavin kinase/FAD synthetase [Pseudomonadota bacterium]
MLILRGFHSPDHQPLALTIGNFDGVHRGHQSLLQRLREEAGARGLQTAVVVFEPHPREFFSPDTAPVRLTNLREKLERFAEMGIDRVQVCRFDESFAQMSATDFIHALCDRLNAKFVLIGDDFRFGRGRSGDFALMEKIAEQKGFQVAAMHSVLQSGIRVSSTAVRTALAEGNLRAAERFLGRPYSISGHVEHGDGLGSGLGFPTANIQMKHNRPPLIGVFAVRAYLEGGSAIDGAASLGVRPTVQANGKPVLEVHLFDFAEKIYGKHLRVEFLHKLRDEMKFPDVQALIKQIALDVDSAKQWLKQHG